MYTDIDSILFDGAKNSTPTRTERWASRIDATMLTREDLCAIYGCWAEDAAKAAFLAQVNGESSLRAACAA